MTKKELWAVVLAIVLYLVGWLGFVQWDRATDCPPWTADDANNAVFAGMFWPFAWPVELIHSTVKTCDVAALDAGSVPKDTP